MRRLSRRWVLRRWAFGWLLTGAMVGTEFYPWWVIGVTTVSAAIVGGRFSQRWVGERTAVYALVAGDGTVLYIGISNDPDERWEQHEDDKPWWPEGVPELWGWHRTRVQALRAERAAIREWQPIYNHVGNLDNPNRVDWRADLRDAA